MALFDRRLFAAFATLALVSAVAWLWFARAGAALGGTAFVGAVLVRATFVGTSIRIVDEGFIAAETREVVERSHNVRVDRRGCIGRLKNEIGELHFRKASVYRRNFP